MKSSRLFSTGLVKVKVVGRIEAGFSADTGKSRWFNWMSVQGLESKCVVCETRDGCICEAEISKSKTTPGCRVCQS